MLFETMWVHNIITIVILYWMISPWNSCCSSSCCFCYSCTASVIIDDGPRSCARVELFRKTRFSSNRYRQSLRRYVFRIAPAFSFRHFPTARDCRGRYWLTPTAPRFDGVDRYTRQQRSVAVHQVHQLEIIRPKANIWLVCVWNPRRSTPHYRWSIGFCSWITVVIII